MKKALLGLVLLFAAGFIAGAMLNYFPSSPEQSEATNATSTIAAAACTYPVKTDDSTRNMVLIPAASFVMGNDAAYREEQSEHGVKLSSFWIDKYEVTNDQFAAFVAETNYVTTAENEQLSGAAVFYKKWIYAEDANWRHPTGGESGIEGKGHHPVVQVSYADAKAYATWLGHDLPTEAQFEYVAQSDTHMKGNTYTANTWQGFFPVENTAADGYLGVAPVGCFKENSFGVYDMIGNVWEWTNDFYAPFHKQVFAEDPVGPLPATQANRQTKVASHVIKGGSYLCAESYCKRYRGSARQPQEADLGTNHLGFRTVKNIQ